MIRPEDIIGGVDITSHYLPASQREFKLFRYRNEVYAVKYDQQAKTLAFVSMWKSHKGENDPKKGSALGAGQKGTVTQKSPDKAIKDLKLSPLTHEQAEARNMMLLQQKFMLHDNGIEDFFVLGLFSTKNRGKAPRYFMPKVLADNQIESPTELENFIHVLKRVNDLGFAHPDYYGGIGKPRNFGNEMHTINGLKFIDLDMGLRNLNEEIEDIEENGEAVEGELDEIMQLKDQWLLVYNHKMKTPGWENVINYWYSRNPGKALSDNPGEILKLFDNNKIGVPATIVAELQGRVALNKGEAKPKETAKPEAAPKPQIDTRSEEEEVEEADEEEELAERARIKSALEDYPKDPQNVLFSVIKGKDLPVLMALLESGANLSTLNREGQPALYLIAKHWDIESLNIVMNKVFGTEAAKALFHAIDIRDNNVLRRLVKPDGSCDFINQVNERNETPLMLAVKQLAGMRGDLRLVTRLLEGGADPSMKNKDGLTAYDLLGERTDLKIRFNAEVDRICESTLDDCYRKLSGIEKSPTFSRDDKLKPFSNAVIRKIEQIERERVNDPASRLGALREIQKMLTSTIANGKIDLKPSEQFKVTMHVLTGRDPGPESDLAPH
jgi:hypothetical protein